MGDWSTRSGALLLLAVSVASAGACGPVGDDDCAATSTCEIPPVADGGKMDAESDRSSGIDGSTIVEAKSDAKGADSSVVAVVEAGDSAMAVPTGQDALTLADAVGPTAPDGQTDALATTLVDSRAQVDALVSSDAQALIDAPALIDASASIDVRTVDAGADAAPLQCNGGKTNCDNQCVDYKTDVKNCGSCGNPCAGVQVCSAGKCCSQGQTNCGGTCADLQSDSNNCSQCGMPCQGVCSAGKCCPSGQTNCGGTCFDLQTNVAHCGTCAKSCTDGVANGTNDCSGGACVPKCEAVKCGTTCCGAAPPNMHATCAGQTCASTPACDGLSLGCTYDGHASCGSWDFESNTTEGWSIFAEATMSASKDGAISATTAQHMSGSHSIAIPYDGTIGQNLAINLPICTTGFAPIENRRLKGYIRLSSLPTLFKPLQEAYSISVMNLGWDWFSGVTYIPQADWYHFDILLVDPNRTPVDPMNYLWIYVILATNNWKGTVYLDQVTIE